MMKNIILILVLLCLQGAALAQRKGSEDFHANWEFGFPVGNHFVTNFSALGVNIGYGRFISNGLAVGIDLGWNNYYQYEPTKTYEFQGGAATTDLYKYIYTLPITAYVTKFFTAGDVFSPFVKLGLGTQYSEQNIYYNIYESTNDNWGFVAIPEIGTAIHFNKYSPWSLNASVKYKYSTNKAEAFNINSVQTLNFAVGVAYMMK